MMRTRAILVSPVVPERGVVRSDAQGRFTIEAGGPKVMARAGLCSRRDAEAWIEAGRVVVNETDGLGEVTSHIFLFPSDLYEKILVLGLTP